MHIFMTGATGLIGSHFIRRHSQYTYTVLSRSKSKAEQMFDRNVSVVSDLGELVDMSAFDAVINLAGAPIIGKRWSGKQKEVIENSRWQTTKQLVDLIKVGSNPPDVFLSGSAIGIYGDNGNEEIDEETVISASDFPSNLCKEWERLALQTQNNTRVVLQRTGIVLSTQGGALTKMLLPFKLNLGGKIGAGQQYMSWIHIDDIIDAMNFVVHEKSCSGPVNMVAPGCVKNAIFAQTLAQALERVALLPAPEPMLKLALGEASQLLLDSQRIAPSKLQQAGFKFSFPELKPALTHLLENST